MEKIWKKKLYLEKELSGEKKRKKKKSWRERNPNLDFEETDRVEQVSY